MRRGNGEAPPGLTSAIACPEIGHPPHIPWRAANGATAPSPSPALWSPGRRGRIPFAAASISSRRSGIGIGQAVHKPSPSMDVPDSFKSWAEVYDHSNSPCAHALWGYRRSAQGRADLVGAHEGSTDRSTAPDRLPNPADAHQDLNGIHITAPGCTAGPKPLQAPPTAVAGHFNFAGFDFSFRPSQDGMKTSHPAGPHSCTPVVFTNETKGS
jgi:hypothetical protein